MTDKTAPTRESMSTFEIVQQVIINELGGGPSAFDGSKVTASADLFGDLGANSLSAVSVIIGLEDEFDIEIPDSDTDDLKIVQDFVGYIDQKLQDKS